MSRYGPNTEAVEALIEKIKTITPEQAEKLFAAWNIITNPDLEIAMYEAVEDTNDEHWSDARQAAIEAMPSDASRAWDTIWDALIALVVRGRVSEEYFDLLYGPWASVMEEQGNE